MTIATINPTTGTVEREFAAHAPDEIEGILERSQVANRMLRGTTFAQRAEWMHRAADRRVPGR